MTDTLRKSYCTHAEKWREIVERSMNASIFSNFVGTQKFVGIIKKKKQSWKILKNFFELFSIPRYWKTKYNDTNWLKKKKKKNGRSYKWNVAPMQHWNLISLIAKYIVSKTSIQEKNLQLYTSTILSLRGLSSTKSGLRSYLDSKC